MTTVLHRLPFVDVPHQMQLPTGELVVIKPRQLAVWVSMLPPQVIVLPSETPAFPALLDTGFNDSFLIQQEHVARWANLDPLALRQTDTMQVYGLSIPVVAANVWIYANQPGTWSADRNLEPFCLELFPGIGMCPEQLGKPRLPLIGMRALMRNRLQTFLNADRRYISMRAR